MTIEELKNMVEAGAVFTSNADAAHTYDYPEVCESIIAAIERDGYRELSGEDYDDAAAQLEIEEGRAARIFAAGEYLLAPDSLREF